ncbi:MAG: isoleucine--tRNA ligase [Bacillota bacterium]|jgi:isoleucyl-tRNA synthetase|nr:isoleucine--tRNA ligase [Bacillota bacterium]HHU43981.1 isoleucine--tRNA ligase [Clostridiales bacterium]
MKKENPNPDFIALEKEILDFWQKNDCFEKLRKKNQNGPRFRFLDGPITANNPMGIHHAWGRTLKDLYIRYNAMLGKSCQYQNGFDAQGLWVEVEVEKEIGVSNKKEILEYGLDKFTEKCIDRVNKFSSIITEQSKRLGQWMDWENSYYTNSDINITSIWYFLKKCHQNGWLIKSQRPMPWCPRCGTSLSEHEMSGSYKQVEHTSIYAKLPIHDSNDSIMVWTTTPWTLSSNVALAVNPDIEYLRVKVKSDSRNLIIGKDALGKLKGDIETVLDSFKGNELVGKEYTTIFKDFECQQFTHKIVPWEDVDAKEGSGVVHIAPGCGAEDFDLGKKYGLKTICPINEEGKFLDGFGKLSNLLTTEVLPYVLEQMEEDGTLYKIEPITHSYPYCWRCKTEVVFKIVDEWYIHTKEIKPLMIEAAKTVNWEPDFAGKRMIDWLSNMGDWNISRKRFYGLPLPFYPCENCGHLTVVGSKEELIELSRNKSLDGVPHLHRPYIDNIKIICPKCGAIVERIPEVGDCWLDAGITAFSTKKYFEDKEYFEKNFPSEMVLEMKEQIRLWFYSLLFMSVTITGKAPYENVVAHSSVINEEGGKFSKTGYMIQFDEAAEKIGADTIRYLFAAASIAGDVRFGYNLADEVRRKLLSFWNVYVFFNLYASLDNPDIASFKPDYNTFTHSDKWLIDRTNQFIDISQKSMQAYKTAALIKEFEQYTDDVSNWYIRINRKRFWKGEDKIDQMNAYWCLYHAIKTTIKILAPIVPFLADYIWQNCVREIEKDEEISVHLSRYPERIAMGGEENVLMQTEVARDIIATAQRMRNEAQIKVKQPLNTLYLILSDEDKQNATPLLDIIKEELNIKEIEFAKSLDAFNDVFFTVNFREAGAKLKGEAQRLKKLVDALDTTGHNQLNQMYEKGSVDIGDFKGLESVMFEKHFRPKQNFIIAEENRRALALDINLSPELIEEGFIRELIRQLQVMRKEADFAVEQRIVADIKTQDQMALRAIEKYKEKIKEDILAQKLEDTQDPKIQKTIIISDKKVEVKLAL